VTNYVSSNDVALRLSRKANSEPRAGDTTFGSVAVKNVVTIDASSVNSELLGHSYFAESPAMIQDLTKLLRDGLNPGARGLKPVGRTEWNWQFPLPVPGPKRSDRLQ